MKFNYVVSSGNEMSVDLADYVNFFAEDEHTRVIALFIEGIRRPQAFMAAAAKALAAGKPIVAIKTGKSQKARDSAKSHTGAIAGDYGAFTAMCERYGIVICQTLDDMIEMLLVFQAGRLPKGNARRLDDDVGRHRRSALRLSGGNRRLATPEFSDATKATLRPMISQELALKNPLDAGNPIDDDADAALCTAIVADPNIDMLAWGWTPPTGTRMRDPARAEASRGHRQAGGRLHPHGCADRPDDAEIPERGRLPVPAGPAGGDPCARRARLLRRAQGASDRRAAAARTARRRPCKARRSRRRSPATG